MGVLPEFFIVAAIMPTELREGNLALRRRQIRAQQNRSRSWRSTMQTKDGSPMTLVKGVGPNRENAPKR